MRNSTPATLPRRLALIASVCVSLSLLAACAEEKPESVDENSNASKSSDTPNAQTHLVKLELQLPAARFTETPKNLPGGLTEIEPPRISPRPLMEVEPGLTNVALNKPVEASDMSLTPVEPAVVTDGDKEAQEGRSLVLFGPQQQYVTVDLGKPYEIHAIAIWRDHGAPKIYYDVIVELAGDQDQDFIESEIIFNNDRDGSSGLGVGEDLPYWEGHEGKLISVDKKIARYVRVYSSGSTHDDFNKINEVEVYAKPAGEEQ